MNSQCVMPLLSNFSLMILMNLSFKFGNDIFINFEMPVSSFIMPAWKIHISLIFPPFASEVLNIYLDQPKAVGSDQNGMPRQQTKNVYLNVWFWLQIFCIDLVWASSLLKICTPKFFAHNISKLEGLEFRDNFAPGSYNS